MLVTEVASTKWYSIRTWHPTKSSLFWQTSWKNVIVSSVPSAGARPTKHISIEFEIRWKFKTL